MMNNIIGLESSSVALEMAETLLIGRYFFDNLIIGWGFLLGSVSIQHLFNMQYGRNVLKRKCLVLHSSQLSILRTVLQFLVCPIIKCFNSIMA